MQETCSQVMRVQLPSSEKQGAPEVSANDERGLDDGPERKVGALLRVRQL